MSVRHVYEQELETLRQDIIKMGNAVGAALLNATKALVEQNAALAKQVMLNDDVIDQMEVDIEDKCMLLIARQQPLARDLRIIATGLKITTDLERMGDHAYDIAKLTLKMASDQYIKPMIDIPRMAQLACQMLQDSLDAYINLDITLAEQVCIADDVVDDIYSQLFRELLTYMIEKPSNIHQATQLLFIARYLERVADHSTNIAEWTIYLVTGQRLRKK